MTTSTGRPDFLRLLTLVDPITGMLTKDVAIEILKLSFTSNMRQSVVSLSLVSKRWEQYVQQDSIWKWLYLRRFSFVNKIDGKKKQTGQSWRYIYKWRLYEERNRVITL
eukprot:TRINITY_DN5523_c0_g1_i3.p1 TRINITY_DN5523_c0_g1~~TRINITY_DN5523_c0_g1_i3.p1  ORF type:complete len:109 (-),score=15.05 TRINITY_DN5523_c0_g1_i3:79-405(-)